MKALSVLSILLLAVFATAFDQNPDLANLPDTTWFLLDDQWHPDRNLYTITDYSGMEYDHHRHKIVIFGHGHAAFAGNEIMEFDINAARWDTLYQYTACERYAAQYAVYDSSGARCGGIYDYNGSLMPGTRHTYNMVIMAPNEPVMILAGSVHAEGNSCGIATANTEWGGNAIWLYDFTTKTWTHTKSGLSGSGSDAPVFDPNTGLLYSVVAKGQGLFVIDLKAQTSTQLTGGGPNWEGKGPAFYYPPNQSILYFGKTNIWEWEIENKRWSKKDPQGTAPSYSNNTVCYDSVNCVFASFAGGKFFYYSYPDNRWYSISYGSQYPPNPIFHNTIYDPVNNVYILVYHPSPTSSRVVQTWAYKFSDTPGRFPGTSGTTKEETLPAVSQGVYIEIRPNPFNGITAISARGSRRISSLHIFDLNGRIVGEFSSLKGYHVTWNASGLVPGVYIVRVTIGNRVLKHKLTLIR